MKILFDLFPVLLFVVVYYMYDLYIATAALMVTSIVQVLAYRLKHGKFETLHLITVAVVIPLGTATLLLHDELYIKWKPTVIYWLFSAVFLFSHFVGDKVLIQRMMASKITLPQPVWRNLNISWAIFFTAMGFINLFFAYSFSTEVWVNFKLFGAFGLMAAFIIVQAIYMSRHMDNNHQPKSNIEVPEK